MDLGLKGKRVLITGASQGIGEGLAEVFAEEGADLFLAARQEDRLKSIAKRVTDAHGVKAEYFPADFTKKGDIDRLHAAAGDIDILVNNAGAIPGGDMWQVGADDWRPGWEVKAVGGHSLQDNIRVVGVNPGPVATTRIEKIMKARAKERWGDESRYGELLANYPLGRAATVREIADMFAFLASFRSSYTSGTIITIDGGITTNMSIGG